MLASAPQRGDREPARALRARELIEREQSAFQTAEYIFKHALLRDVTSRTVLKRVRKAYMHRWRAAVAHSGDGWASTWG